MQRRSKKCLTRGCSKKAASRGLCPSCYATANYDIEQGRTSWERLEAEGQSLPLIRNRNNPMRRALAKKK
jgi:hypothetical protein